VEVPHDTPIVNHGGKVSQITEWQAGSYFFSSLHVLDTAHREELTFIPINKAKVDTVSTPIPDNPPVTTTVPCFLGGINL
jgi:hypothetical protein